MITATLATVFIWCLFYGLIAQPFLALLCVVLGVFVACAGRHRHTQMLFSDVLAQKSRLRNINPAFKFWTLLILMIISAASKNAFTGIFLALTMLAIAVFAGGLSIRQYAHILTLPVSFLLIGGIALLFEITAEPVGVINFQVFGFWLCVSAKTQAQTALVVSRALGAVSCLSLLSVTTPMPDITGVLRRARCPDIIIDLMYLIYRYIFILLSLHRDMHSAAKSRLGFRDYRTGMLASGKIYANLLARSYRFACINFDAMESRCYDTGISFLEHRYGVTYAQAGVSVALVIVSLAVCMF